MSTPIAWLGIVLFAATLSASAETSELWGTAGEKWSPTGRLPNFAFAGYRRGEEPYRQPQQQISVKDHGAAGDGKTDDTQAFRAAIAVGAGSVIWVPPGRYLISDALEIRTAATVLKGAGAEACTLIFQKSLESLRPNSTTTADGVPTSAWSWSGGLIDVQGTTLTGGLALPVAPAMRGDTRLQVTSHSFQPGDDVLLTLTGDAAQTLIRYLYHDDPGDISGLRSMKCQQAARVVSAEGDVIVIDRPLRFDLRSEWSPVIASFAPNVTDVGIEGFSFEFPAEAYPGHFREQGWNALQFGTNTAHCWARGLRILNADNGIFVKGHFTTLEGITIAADRARHDPAGIAGHHGITLGGADGLCAGFVFETRFIHDLTLETGSIGNVFSKGRAVDLNLDHHRFAPYENLFTDLDAGAGTRLFESGGGSNRGRHSGAGATFWGIRSKSAQKWPENFGPDRMNLVGLKMRGPESKKPGGRWIETIAPEKLMPADLHQAMRQRRLPAPSDVPPQVHSWTSQDGRVIQAVFGGLSGNSVQLIVNGKAFHLPLLRLSTASQEQARRLAQQPQK